MYKIINVVLFIVLSLLTLDLNSQWVLQNSGTTENLYSVYFADDNTGYVCGRNGIILKSTNGGTSWFLQNSGVSSNLSEIKFIDINTGFAAGNEGILLKTISGGELWEQVNLGTDASLNSLYFSDSLTGWVVGSSKIYKTTNRGEDWFEQIPDSAETFNSVFFIDNNTGWITGYRTLKTTNGGIDWITKDRHVNALSIFFVNHMTGWNCGAPFKIFKNTDGGETWEEPMDEGDSPPTVYTCLSFIDENTGWYTTYHSFAGSVKITTNCGLNWTLESVSSSMRYRGLHSVYARGINTAWAVGQRGTILKRSGLTGLSGNSQIPGMFSLEQNYPNPFNPVTTVKFYVPEAAKIEITIFDITGKQLDLIAAGIYLPGEYEAEWNAEKYSSGVYFYRMTAGDYSETKTMVLIK